MGGLGVVERRGEAREGGKTWDFGPRCFGFRVAAQWAT